VDDRIPCRESNNELIPFFYASKYNETWPIILEKALAKHFGSYLNFEGSVKYNYRFGNG
jgi:hypothetical protein